MYFKCSSIGRKKETAITIEFVIAVLFIFLHVLRLL